MWISSHPIMGMTKSMWSSWWVFGHCDCTLVVIMLLKTFNLYQKMGKRKSKQQQQQHGDSLSFSMITCTFSIVLTIELRMMSNIF